MTDTEGRAEEPDRVDVGVDVLDVPFAVADVEAVAECIALRALPLPKGGVNMDD